MNRRNLFASGMALAMPLFAGPSLAVPFLGVGMRSRSALQPKTVSYGAAPEQSLDIYLPKGDCYAWAVMVHGGGWRRGDKAMSRTVDNKVARWTERNIGVVSINYRMLPQAPVETQIEDVRSAVSFLQRKGSTLGLFGPMVLMGHSAGAHLVAFVGAQIQTTEKAGIAPWAGTVILDSGTLDVPRTMARARLPLYKNAFGSDEKRWALLSPIHQLQPGVGPTMIVYSTTRKDDVADQAQLYAQRLTGFGVRNVQTLGVELEHSQVNEQLGLQNDYTKAVEAFMSSLHPTFERSFSKP